MNKFFLFFCFSIQFVFSQTEQNLYDFIFPLNLEPNYTSNFGEYRSNHFHGGIDISTNHTTGIKALASRDGYIEKISISPSGYGKNLTIHHYDGYKSFYAHLKNFPKNIELLILKEQKILNKYSVTINFDENDLPVKKGEVIAFSGQSGAGGPHLHFEIYNNNGDLINPLIFPNIKNIIDAQTPNFTSFVAIPLTIKSNVGHNFFTQKFTPKKISDSKFKIEEIIHLNGEIGFGIEIIDYIYGRDDRLIQNNLKFEIDGNKILSTNQNFMKQNEYRQVSLFYDFNSVQKFNDKIQKLFLEKNTTIPFYNFVDSSRGIISLKNFKEGFHTFKITAEDYIGNSSTLEGKFLLTNFPKISIIDNKNDFVNIKIDSIKKVNQIETRFQTKNNTWINYKYSIPENQNSVFTIPIAEKKYSQMKIFAISSDGSSSFPFYFSTENNFLENSNLTIEPILSRENLFLKINSQTPLSSMPSVIYYFNHINEALEVFQISKNDFIVPIPEKTDKQFSIKIFYKTDKYYFEKTFEIFTNKIKSGNFSLFSSIDKILQIKILSNALQNDAQFLIKKINGKAFKIEHTAGVLNDGVTISYKLNQNEINNNKLALYSGNAKNWNFTTNKINPTNNSFEDHSPRTLNSYTILEDKENPVIGNLKINPFYDENSWLFQFALKDNLSGISSSSLIVKLDGERIFPDYDTDKEKVLYFPINRIKSGKHNLKISVSDNVGNFTSFNKSFKLIF